MNDVRYLFIEEVFWGAIDKCSVEDSDHTLCFELQDCASRRLFEVYPERPYTCSKEVYFAEGIPIQLRAEPDSEVGAVTYTGCVFLNPKIPEDADMPRHEAMDPPKPWTIRATFSRSEL